MAEALLEPAAPRAPVSSRVLQPSSMPGNRWQWRSRESNEAISTLLQLVDVDHGTSLAGAWATVAVASRFLARLASFLRSTFSIVP